MSLADTRPDPQLPADHAFVLQLRKGSALTGKNVEGEVEHIVSGQHAEFRSLAELAAFMEHVLAASLGDSI